jgi:GMP synthase (glutamine-hydrolysing)
VIVFVDYEHAAVETAAWRDKLLAARTWITYRLEDLSGKHCVLVRYDRITPDLLRTIDAQAIFISGNSTEPERYDRADLEPLGEIVEHSGLPVFGFCGGFQFIATVLGTPLTTLDVDPDSELAATLRPFPSGALGEVGYHPIDIVADHPVLADVGARPVVRHAHALQVPELPTGFRLLASTPATKVQMAVDDDRRILGTQFHPEYYTDEHPAGEQMIRNFLRWADITP